MKTATFALFVALTMLALALSGCFSGGSGGNDTLLSPGPTLENITGTWKTAFPVKFNIATEECGDELQLAATEDWEITFVITAGADENHVNIEMSFTTSNFQVVNGCPGAGVIPEVSPLSLTGTISSVNLALKTKGFTEIGTTGQGQPTEAGNFHFTTDILTGTFDYTSTSFGGSQREYTKTNGLILKRQ